MRIAVVRVPTPHASHARLGLTAVAVVALRLASCSDDDDGHTVESIVDDIEEDARTAVTEAEAAAAPPSLKPAVGRRARAGPTPSRPPCAISSPSRARSSSLTPATR